jgi:dipeptidyl aminopeptidase/acylaminoacyl peptidase
LDLFEKIKLILETQGYVPFDIGNRKSISIGPFLTPSNAMILHMNTFENPNDHTPILAEDSFADDAKFSPDDSWITVPIDYSGKENHKLYRLPVDSSERPIPKEQLGKIAGRCLSLDWNPDGTKIAWVVSRQETSQIAIQPNEINKDERIIWEGDEMAQYLHWTHSNFLKFTKINGKTGEFHEVVLNPSTGEEIVSIPVANLFNFDSVWHPNKPIIPFVNREDSALTLLDINSDEKRVLSKLEGELETVAWSTNGDNIFISATKDARDTIYSINLDSMETNPLPLPVGVNKILKIRNWNSEDTLFFIHADATTRINLWRFGFQSHEIVQLTKKRSPKIGTDEFPLVNSISEYWKSNDGLQIHGFVMVPQEPQPPEGYPALVFVHGGPTGQDVDTFVGTYQILVQEGFVVFRPNFRGSTGYGPKFQRANYREIGKADLLDIVAGVEMLVEKYNVNSQRVGITGGSYGGYMTLRALTKPDVFEFAAGWAEAAIADFQYMQETGDAIFREYIKYLFGPYDDKETRSAIKEASPITDWEKVCKPLGVVQLANDTRTPLKPVWDFVNLLIERGDNVEFHVEPAMGHANIPKGFLTRSIARRVQFFQKTLL